MIDKIAVESDYDNIYLTNALFILNSKCGLLWGGYTHADNAEFEYCYQERVVATRHRTLVEIKDMISQRYQYLPYDFLRKPAFNLVNWWRSDLRHPCSRHHTSKHWPNLSKSWAILEEDHSLNREDDLTQDGDYEFEYSDTESIGVEVYGIRAKAGMYSALQRNSSNICDTTRPIPKPLVIVFNINGHPARALVDSGSLSDFISGALVQQLNLQKEELIKPLQVQMAVQGSRSKVNYGTRVRITYQGIKEECYFDVMNLSNYDLILGTPFLYQHKVSLCLDPPAIVIRSNTLLPLKGLRIKILASQAAELYKDNLQEVR
jgi:hypothetical protein